MREMQKGPPGTTWFRLESQDELDNESKKLNHLAALLYAHAKANDVDMEFLSLRRDTDNAPIVTMQVVGKEIRHAAAKDNKLPPKIAQAIRDFANATRTPIKDGALKYTSNPGDVMKDGLPPDMWTEIHREALQQNNLLDKIPLESLDGILSEKAASGKAEREDAQDRDSRAIGHAKWK